MTGRTNHRDEGRIDIQVAGVAGARTQRPLVKFQYGDQKPIYFYPERDREIGRRLVEAAVPAEADTALVVFLMDHVGLDLNQAGQIQMEFRKLRDERAREGREN